MEQELTLGGVSVGPCLSSLVLLWGYVRTDIGMSTDETDPIQSSVIREQARIKPVCVLAYSKTDGFGGGLVENSINMLSQT